MELDKFQTIAKAEDTRFELATPERGASFPMRLLAIRLSSQWRVIIESILSKSDFSSRGGEGGAISNFQLAITQAPGEPGTSVPGKLCQC